MYGVDSYLALGAVWTIRFARLYIPRNLLDGVGCVVRTPPGSPPTPKGRNWLKLPPRTSQRGNVHDITLSYMLSGIGGWVEDVYFSESEDTANAPGEPKLTLQVNI